MCADFPCSNREASVDMPSLLLWQSFSHSLSAGLKREILVISPTIPQCTALSHFMGSCSVSRRVSASAGHTSAKPVRQVKHEIRRKYVLAPPPSHTHNMSWKSQQGHSLCFFPCSLFSHLLCSCTNLHLLYRSVKAAQLPFNKKGRPHLFYFLLCLFLNTLLQIQCNSFNSRIRRIQRHDLWLDTWPLTHSSNIHV